MTTLQLQAYELISKLTDAQLHLIIDLMKDLTSTGESLNNLKNIRRKLGMFKGEKFLADNYHLDDDNKEIEKDNINVEENQNSVVSELKEAIKEQAIEEEKPQSSNFTLRKILGGDFLSSEMLKKQIWVIILIAMFTLVYVSNRYSCQKDLLRINELNIVLLLKKLKMN